MEVTETIRTDASAAEVWSVVGNVGEIALWVEGVTESHLEGDVRHMTLADGTVARERVTERDDEQLSYSYTALDGPLPVTSYRSRLSVLALDGAGSIVSWTGEFTADETTSDVELVAPLANVYRVSLERLKAQLEG